MGKHSPGNLYNRYREWVGTSKSSGEKRDVEDMDPSGSAD